MATQASPSEPAPAAPIHERRAVSLFQREIVVRSLIDSVKKLDPRVQIHNPVMFVVEIGSVITTVTWLIQVFGGKPLGGGHEEAWYTFTISFWLWLTVILATVSLRIARSVSAWARPRPSAKASAMFAKMTVSHSQKEIVNVYHASS